MARQVSITCRKDLTKTVVISDTCDVADSLLERALGLIGRKTLEDGRGLFFPRCKSIHMWFMSMSIDVVFVKEEASGGNPSTWIVSSLHEGVRPWKLMPLNDFSADAVIELPRNTIGRTGLTRGDALCINSK